MRDAQIARLGPDHPDTLTTLDNLAAAYEAAGKLAEAIALFERVRDARVAKLGPDHPDTLITLNNLATAYMDAGRLPEAIALLERVRDAQIAKLGPDHPDTLTTLNNLAVAYWTRSDSTNPCLCSKTCSSGERPSSAASIRIRRGRWPTSGSTTRTPAGSTRRSRCSRRPTAPAASSRTFAGSVLRSSMPTPRPAGRPRPRRWSQEFLADARKAAPKDSPQLAVPSFSPASSLLQVKAYAEAEPILRECLAIREKTQPDLWTTFNAKVDARRRPAGPEEVRRGRAAALAGYEGMKQREATIPPQWKPRLTEALERLVQLYEATDRPDEAATMAQGAGGEQGAGKPAEKKP